MSPLSNPCLNREAAGQFLANSRSTFLQAAGEWLITFDDPADVLLLLSEDVGQHLGPWDCFRHCALLGLHHSAAVKSLALDVLSEQADPDRGPPIAPALAVAWAVDRYPDEEAPFAQALLAQLVAQRDDPRADPILVDAAQLALCGSAGASPAASAAAELEAKLAAALASSSGPALGVPIWEAAALSHSTLAARARSVVSGGQQADGGLSAPSDHPLVRGFATLRGMALEARAFANAD